MALLGRTSRAAVNRFVEFGAYLDCGQLGEVLLPQKYVPHGAQVGDVLEVFVYRDSEDRLVATTSPPLAEVGDCAFLEVVDVNKVGAFMDWGLQRDLFVPFGEQHKRMVIGKSYVVFLYVDNTDRIAASSKLSKFLSTTTDEYAVGDEVDLIVSRRTDLGFEVAVDDLVLGMVFKSDALTALEPGMRTTGYVKEVRDDGKLNLALEKPGARDDLGERIIAQLRTSGGSSSLTDKSSPDDIFAAFGVSKRAYKQAIGGLYRERRILIEAGRISIVESDDSDP